MADVLPVATDRPAIEARPAVRRYCPSATELARQAAAAAHLAQAATEAHLSSAEYVWVGLHMEQHHQLDDPAVPDFHFYTRTGGTP